ncbi:M56 family metallopeptidase [Sphingobacterium cavernae]|uniref:M56 family metallopeptidase n=1 Tax=Sphingobacterium cavernae TaxID=2592657 RepID=UPI00123012AB|nr:M56 family metallopeptidase [Sphingobacterium cavernae]
MVIYLLLVNIAVIISYSLYYFSFRKLTFFQWNRVYLLSTAFFALLIPIGLFIDLSTFFEDDIIIPMVNVHEFIDIPIVLYVQQNSSLYLVDVLKWFYIVGLIASVSIIFWRLWNVRKMFQVDAPFLGFSFFNKMFLGKEVNSYKSIERHEEIHIEQGHSYDILFMELFKALNWFNPVVYHLSKEIKFQHECIADELSSEDKVAYAELLVAHALKVPQNVLVHEFSNQSFLKKRIMMLFKNKSSKNKRFLYLGIIPAVLVVGISTVIFNTSRAKSVVAKVESKIEDVKLPTQSTTLQNIDYTKDRDLPEPEIGIDAFTTNIYKEIQKKIKESKEQSLQVYMNVKIQVLKNGSVGNIDIDSKNNEDYKKLVSDLVKRTKWLPAQKNGVSVDAAREVRLGTGTFGRNSDLSSQEGGNEIFSETEILPEPPESMDAFRKWIGNNYQYPQAAINAGVKGTIRTNFVIEKDGSLSDIKIVKDLGHGTGEAALELLKKSPKWKPAIQNGRKVRYEFTLPIRLDLTNMGEVEESAQDTIQDKSGGKIVFLANTRSNESSNYTAVEIIPEPPGGMTAYRKWIGDNYKYPQAAIDAEVKGTVQVTFVVEKDGSLSDLKVVRDLGHGTGNSAIAVLKTSKRWSPGIQNGKTVHVAYSLPIRLDLTKM